jgi:CRISPR-associated endonuclease Csn1
MHIYEYKNHFYANTGDNYMFGLYENEYGRKIISINVFESTKYSLEKNMDSPKEIFKSKEPVMIGSGKNVKEGSLIHIFLTGQKVLFFIESKEELKELTKAEISNRLYFIKRFHQAERGNIIFQHHLEARSDDELTKDFGTLGKNGFSIDKLNSTFSPPRILFTPNKEVFIIEGKDFDMKLDGKIIFKF